METFLAWRKQFEMETGIAAKREKDLKDQKKLTGKELFIRDTTLNESDLKFLDDGLYIHISEYYVLTALDLRMVGQRRTLHSVYYILIEVCVDW